MPKKPRERVAKRMRKALEKGKIANKKSTRGNSLRSARDKKIDRRAKKMQTKTKSNSLQLRLIYLPVFTDCNITLANFFPHK